MVAIILRGRCLQALSVGHLSPKLNDLYHLKSRLTLSGWIGRCYWALSLGVLPSRFFQTSCAFWNVYAPQVIHGFWISWSTGSTWSAFQRRQKASSSAALLFSAQKVPQWLVRGLQAVFWCYKRGTRLTCVVWRLAHQWISVCKYCKRSPWACHPAGCLVDNEVN